MLKIASIGDVCVDVYPQEKQYFLGGTAFNRAVYLAQNGIKVSLISAIGTDNWGKQYLSTCKRLKINTDYLAVIPGTTSHVDIRLDQNHQPQFSAWNLGVLKNYKPKALPEKQDAVIATYLKPIKPLVVFPSGPFRAADFCGGSIYSPQLSIIKQWLPHLDLAVRSADQAEIPHLKQLAKSSNKMILATLGKNGSILFSGQKEYRQAATSIKTADATGAGDAYITAFVIKYLQIKNIPAAMSQAAQAATTAITSPRNLSV